MPKEHVVIFVLLCIIAFGLGYWYSTSKGDSDERAEVRTPPAPTVVTNITTNIVPASSQSAVEKAVRNELNKPTGELTKADFEKVTKLHLRYKQLTDVKGLEKLTQLTHLLLDGNQLADVKRLEKLTQLKTLNLFKNQLTDVTGLEKLTQLKKLVLASNQLTDLKRLENLTQLTELYLAFNPDLTRAQINQLQKALPNCRIVHNAKK